MNRTLIILALLLFGCWDTGTGEKIGTITKIARQGVFCKTWEGQMIRGGLNSATGAFGMPFDFTVENEDLAEQVRSLMERQVEVKIKYRSELVTFCRSDSEGNHFLTKIEEIRNEH